MSKDSVGYQIEQILQEIGDEIEKISEKDFKKAAQNTKQKLTAYAPVGHNEYRQGFSYKKQDGGYIVYNKLKPGLTHLLNNGHMVKNQYGSYGRVNGDNHMGRAEQEAIQDLMDDLSKDLNNI